MRTLKLLTVIVALFSLAVAAEQPGRKKPRVRSEMLITTDSLAKRLQDPRVVVLNVSRDASDYAAGHIPGARFLSMSDIVVTRNGVPNELPPVEQLKAVFERLGIGDETKVVLYGDQFGLHAARAFFTLDYLGHGDKVAMLDGGLEKWRAEKRPIIQDVPAVKPARFTPHVKPEVVLDLETMRKLVARGGDDKSPRSALLDARPPEQYTGKDAGAGVPRGGHIPGSRNLFWMQTLKSEAEPVLKPADELLRMFQAAGAPQGSTIVTYCRTGVQASHLYFTAKYLGYKVAMYDGSFLEWSNVPDLGVEK